MDRLIASVSSVMSKRGRRVAGAGGASAYPGGTASTGAGRALAPQAIPDALTAEVVEMCLRHPTLNIECLNVSYAPCNM